MTSTSSAQPSQSQNNPSTTTTTNGNTAPSEFTLRRAALIGEIGDSLESVLTQINALNRSLEGIIEIGNEFASVEALWSQFETVMGRGSEEGEEAREIEEGEGEGEGQGGS